MEKLPWKEEARKNLLAALEKYPGVSMDTLDAAYLVGLEDVPEIVICAAVRAPDGYIIRGHRHADAIRTMSEIPRYKNDRPYSGNQGFVTSKNRFVDRVEACKIQKAAGIKSVLEGVEAYLHGELYSEDLY